jgi:hypothetical protein
MAINITDIIEFPYLKYLVFSDAEVLKIQKDMIKKTFSISVNNAHYCKGSTVCLGNGTLFVKNWSVFESRIYNINEEWEYRFEELKDICEFFILNDQIILKGFSKVSGNWVEYTFQKVEAYFSPFLKCETFIAGE